MLWQLEHQNGLMLIYNEGRDHDALGGLPPAEAFEIAEIDPYQMQERIYCFEKACCGQSAFKR